MPRLGGPGQVPAPCPSVQDGPLRLPYHNATHWGPYNRQSNSLLTAAEAGSPTRGRQEPGRLLLRFTVGVLPLWVLAQRRLWGLPGVSSHTAALTPLMEAPHCILPPPVWDEGVRWWIRGRRGRRPSSRR